MKFLFYLWGIVNLIFFVLPFIYDAKNKARGLIDLLGWTKSMKGKKYEWHHIPEEFKSLIIYFLLMIVFFVPWMLIGLFTFNWFIFLLYWVSSFTVGRIGSSIRKAFNVGGYATWLVIWNIYEAAFIIFVLINSYHLKIDVWQHFINLF